MSATVKQINTAPARSLNQRMEALQRANQVRSKRAALKADLKRGKASIVTVLGDPPEFLASAKIMEMCRVSQSKTVGGLSDRQRRELLAYFGG
jgi:hypothetical protein